MKIVNTFKTELDSEYTESTVSVDFELIRNNIGNDEDMINPWSIFDNYEESNNGTIVAWNNGNYSDLHIFNYFNEYTYTFPCSNLINNVSSREFGVQRIINNSSDPSIRLIRKWKKTDTTETTEYGVIIRTVTWESEDI